MIIDCFSFFNEIKILLLRLHYLYDYVDRFVIVESDRTHIGNPKPYYLEQWWDAIPTKFLDKISKVRVQIEADDGSHKKVWTREYGQRIAMIRYVHDRISTSPNDQVLVSDLDEIPHRDLLIFLRRSLVPVPLKLEQLLMMYNPDTYQEPWRHALVCPASVITPENVNQMRLDKNLQLLADAGWHFSYHMSPELILHKIQNFAHPEFNRPEYDLEYVKTCIRNRTPLFKQFGEAPYQQFSRDRYPRDLRDLLDLYFPRQDYGL